MCDMLIVEDNKFFRKALKDILETGFPSSSIEEAADGEEAVRKMDALNPDLIFLDIKLPDINGLELAKRIRASHATPSIIMLTSYDLPEYKSAAYKCGANHFFVKGTISPAQLIEAVEPLVRAS